MPMTMTGDLAVFEGTCAVEEAETLLAWLRDTPGAKVDMAGCEHIHTAVLQTLLAVRPTIVSSLPDPLLARLLGLERSKR